MTGPLEIEMPLVDGDLLVRPWEPDDAPLLTAATIESLDHLRSFMPWASSDPMTVAWRLELIQRWEQQRSEGGDLVLGIWRDGQVVGGTGLHRRGGPGVLEIGYWVHVDHVRHKIASRASWLLTTAAFTIPETSAVEIWHDRANVASGGVPKRLGYRLLGEHPARGPERAPGDEGIECQWRVTREEWEQLAAPSGGTTPLA